MASGTAPAAQAMTRCDPQMTRKTFGDGGMAQSCRQFFVRLGEGSVRRDCDCHRHHAASEWDYFGFGSRSGH
jgi:hypothetical protein